MTLRLIVLLLGGFGAHAALAQPAALYGAGDLVDRQGQSVGRLSLLQTPHVIRGDPPSRTSRSPSLPGSPGKALERDGWGGVAPGMAVQDSRGRVIGEFEAWGRSATGPMAILQIDGMLVSVPRDTLRVADGRIASRQSKAEILAAAGAAP
ncbi:MULTISPECIES: hypothetical protein [unclassified Phenylobacterium]|uniref:hypothetical protein n=1 Tax=unclassified Phenylobacterium TaxID=2640670 RepID=UPI00083A0B4A|nr:MULTISPECIES: hypothetical protein [unclassified Phenylobacterium]